LLDQSFSAENFKIISDLDNRLGSNINSLFFNEVKLKIDVVKNSIQKIRLFRQVNAFPYDAAKQKIYDALQETKKEAKEELENTIKHELQAVSKTVASKGFSIKYSRSVGPSGKPIYILADSPAAYYATKQINRNINRLYKVRQANKNLICSQVGSLLTDSFPYYVVRTDISKFYESVDQTILLQKLKNDQLLGETSLRLITGILRRYCSLSNSPSLGLPRGIGVSAYLSELFMRDFDKKMKGGKDVVFYARYVDDIVIMFAPSFKSDQSKYLDWITESLAQINLTLNPLKTDTFSKEEPSWSFVYLGYKFSRLGNKVDIALSPAKFKKYKARLRACFRAYEQEYSKNRKSAYRKLLKRVKFLTVNTRLSHSKKNAFVGIYFSSPHLTNLSQLTALDQIKDHLSLKPSISNSLRDKLKRFSFHEGYEQRKFRSFKRDADFETIVKAWKYVQ